MAKVGYGIKDFDDPDIDSDNDLLLSLQIDHKFNLKNSLMLFLTRSTKETNISTTNSLISNNIYARYTNRLTEKITGFINLSYTLDDYQGELTFGGETKERDDDTYRIGVRLQYAFKKWLRAGAGYRYIQRVSNFSDFDYTNNSVFISLTGTM